jgi:spore maturation protein CgeB
MRKKLLFISSVSSVYHIPLWEAFEYYGFDVHFIDFRGNGILMPGNIIHRAVGKLPEALNNFVNKVGNKMVDEEILAKAIEIKPDYIFATKAKYISISVLEKLRQIAPTINWYMDRMNNWGSIKRTAAHYDYIFNPDRYIVDLLRAEGHMNAYHLPWAGYLSKDAQWPDNQEFKYNLVFLGSYHPQIFPRASSFEGLRELGLNIWGNKGWLSTPLRDCYRGFIAPNMAEIQKVYAASKIGLSFDSTFDYKGTSPTLRPFEITTAGSMMLGQLYRAELPELFEPGRDFVPFSTPEEMREKATYYLKHDDERKTIAKNGFERARSDHTFYDRVRRVFETIERFPINS